MFLQSIGEFLGRFHPLMVHLPIGFLLLAIIFSFLSSKEKFVALKQGVPFALLIGSVSAVSACITGYMLSLGGDYNEKTLTTHMYTGIATALVSIFAWLISINKIKYRLFQSGKTFAGAMVLILILVSVAGHFGGSLTHGEGYLMAGLDAGKSNEKKVFTSIDDAVMYMDVVAPILEAKCSNCHNKSKMKGKLNMEDFASLMKGGKHGKVIKPGNALASEMIKRVMLSPDDKKFMPADGKTPLTDEEKNIIKWWIDKTNASDKVTMAKATPSPEIETSVAGLLGLPGGKKIMTGSDNDTGNINVNNYFTQLKLPSVTKEAFEKLSNTSWVVKQINTNPDLLDVSFYPNTTTTLNAEAWAALTAVKDNVIWLNLAANNLSDAQMDAVQQCTNLQRLRLEKNPVTDVGVAKLKTLQHLEMINLYQTKVTNKSIATLSSLPHLKSVYAWNTGVNARLVDTTNTKFAVVVGAN